MTIGQRILGGVLLSCLLSAPLRAQDTTGYSVIDLKARTLNAKQVPDFNSLIKWFSGNFSTEDARVRAVYSWMVSHFAYDVENMFKIDEKENRKQKVARFLQTGKGICENYAYTFDSICRQLGMHSYMVGGCTRQQGKLDSLPHAWCAVEVDGEWYMFDPTWGAGYLQQGKFVPYINYAHYKVSPSKFVLTHLPFDPLWQMLQKPYTTAQFIAGDMEQPLSQNIFSFRDSLLQHELQPIQPRLEAVINRIESEGIIHDMIAIYVNNLKSQLHQYRQQALAITYNLAVADFNQAIASFNRYIVFKNKQFKPEKSDSALLALVNKPLDKLEAATIHLEEIAGPDPALEHAIKTMQHKLIALSERQKEELAFVTRYLQQDKTARKSMFLVKTNRRVPVKRTKR